MRAGPLVLVCLLASSCHRHRAERIDPDAPVRVKIGDSVVTVEVVDLPDTVKRGLMDRDSLGAEAGMLFFMGKEKDWVFYMHDTKIPLDILFITKQLTVAGVVHDAVPMSEKRLMIGELSLYVLEVNAGWAAKHGVAKGQPVTLENIKL